MFSFVLVLNSPGRSARGLWLVYGLVLVIIGCLHYLKPSCFSEQLLGCLSN